MSSSTTFAINSSITFSSFSSTSPIITRFFTLLSLSSISLSSSCPIFSAQLHSLLSSLAIPTLSVLLPPVPATVFENSLCLLAHSSFIPSNSALISSRPSSILYCLSHTTQLHQYQ